MPSHFWDLRPERLPYQRYLLHELVADMHCGHVRSTVFIETRAMYHPDGPVELRPVGRLSLSRAWPPPAPVACMAPAGQRPPLSAMPT